MDWNGDGKHDWKDDAFYNNVIAPEKNSESSHGGSSSHRNTNNNTHNTQGYSESSCKGWSWFIIFCVIYGLIKLIGG